MLHNSLKSNRKERRLFFIAYFGYHIKNNLPDSLLGVFIPFVSLVWISIVFASCKGSVGAQSQEKAFEWDSGTIPYDNWDAGVSKPEERLDESNQG